MLLEWGVSLMAKDKSYGNTALSTLYLEILKTRSDEEMAFLEEKVITFFANLLPPA